LSDDVAKLDIDDVNWFVDSLNRVLKIFVHAKLKLEMEEEDAEAYQRDAETYQGDGGDGDKDKDKMSEDESAPMEAADACQRAEVETNEQHDDSAKERKKKKKDKKDKKGKKDKKEKEDKKEKDKDKNMSLSTTVESLQTDSFLVEALTELRGDSLSCQRL